MLTNMRRVRVEFSRVDSYTVDTNESLAVVSERVRKAARCDGRTLVLGVFDETLWPTIGSDRPKTGGA